MTQRRSDGTPPGPRPRKKPTQGRSGGTSATRTRDSQRNRKPEASRPARAPGAATRGGWFGRFARISLLILLMVFLAVAVTGCAVYASMARQLPDPDITKAKGRDQTTIIYDRSGKILTRVFAEENRQDVPLSDMPQSLRQAVIATEDQRFYEHEGVDPISITRALMVDIIKREKAQGGSTITQQYVKQAFVTTERTLKRKVQEAILAQRVEKRYTKDQILENYLNTIYFGHGAYGVEAASRAYFGKSVTRLSVPESAVIAGVIKSPGRYSPYLDKDAALLRRNTVLSQMKAQGYLTPAEHAQAAATPIELTGKKKRSARAPYYVEWIKQQLVDEFGEQAVYRGGLRVKTTLDPKAQSIAEKAIGDALDKKDDPSAALVAIKPATGEIVAMVGGRSFDDQQYNVAVQGKRQPGSAFKPFVLATALSEGISPEKAYKSGPAKLKVGNQTWSVTGAHGSSKGTMRLRPATEQSVNSVFAQLILEVGPDKVVGVGERLGLSKGIDPVPAIALGGLEQGVSPLEMASAYSTLANGGQRAKPYAIASVTGPKGEVLLKTAPKTTRAINAAVAYLTTDILEGVIDRGTGTAADIDRPAAGKTGTTQEYRDAWFVGYTPDLACAVWVGYPESQKEMKSVHGRVVTGGSIPAEIWATYMRKALADTPKTKFDKPKGLTTVKVCSQSGGLAIEYCPKPISALTLTEFEPKPCEIHKEPIEVKVPKLTGMPKEDALAKLSELKLKAKVVEKAVSGVGVGIVADQTPASGGRVKVGTTVTLTVATGEAADQPPVALFTPPENPKSGKETEFDASASSDDGKIVTYYWEFGDGQTASGKTVKHAWATAGSYEVTLWVTDDSGQQGSVTRVVAVK